MGKMTIRLSRPARASTCIAQEGQNSPVSTALAPLIPDESKGPATPRTAKTSVRRGRPWGQRRRTHEGPASACPCSLWVTPSCEVARSQEGTEHASGARWTIDVGDHRQCVRHGGGRDGAHIGLTSIALARCVHLLDVHAASVHVWSCQTDMTCAFLHTDAADGGEECERASFGATPRKRRRSRFMFAVIFIAVGGGVWDCRVGGERAGAELVNGAQCQGSGRGDETRVGNGTGGRTRVGQKRRRRPRRARCAPSGCYWYCRQPAPFQSMRPCYASSCSSPPRSRRTGPSTLSAGWSRALRLRRIHPELPSLSVLCLSRSAFRLIHVITRALHRHCCLRSRRRPRPPANTPKSSTSALFRLALRLLVHCADYLWLLRARGDLVSRPLQCTPRPTSQAAKHRSRLRLIAICSHSPYPRPILNRAIPVWPTRPRRNSYLTCLLAALAEGTSRER
jgi:hypothetical protein